MKEKEPEEGPLEQLDSKLHRWQDATSGVRRSSLSRLPGDLPRTWSVSEPETAGWWSRLSWLNLALVVAAIFFVTMLGFFGWWLFQGSGRVSLGNIDLSVAGPQTVKAGEEAVVNVTLTNRNKAPLQFADLIVEYPPGTHSANQNQNELTRQRFQLGTVKSGETFKQTVKFVLFGEQDTEAALKVSVEYRLDNSNAIFDKSTNYALAITDAPITLSLLAPEAISIGQKVELKVDVQSDSEAEIANPTVLVHYPLGFKFEKASLPPVKGSTERWDFNFLKPGDKKEIVITGSFAGEDNEVRSFRGEVGVKYQEADSKLAILYDTDTKSVNVQKSYVNLATLINGESGAEIFANNRDEFQVEISWTNTMAEAITDGEMTVFIEGEGIDRNSLNVSRGFYRSSDSSINWNKVAVKDLAKIEPGEGGKLGFSFSAASLVGGANKAALKNPSINFRIHFRGKRVLAEEEGASEPVESEVVRTVKLNSVVDLAEQVLKRTGPIANSGPLPPKVGQKTTYTVVWSLSNSSNELTGTQVVATLPMYVEWTGEISPTTEAVQFIPADGGGGEIIWQVGTVRAETGSRYPRREVSFQVALTPSAGQLGQTVDLVGAPAFSTTDTFTGQKIKGELNRNADTYLVSEAGFRVGEEKVVE